MRSWKSLFSRGNEFLKGKRVFSTENKLNKYSSQITQPKRQGASQAMLLATGLTPKQLDLPQIGIASVWYDGNPCNMHLLNFATGIKKSVQDADLVGMRFNAIGVSDGISMGTDGMRYSLQSREIIADSIETVVGAQWYDGVVVVPGCDKNMPGALIAMGRLNRPGLIVYGGTIRAGCSRLPGHPEDRDKLDIVSAFQSYGEFIAGKISEEERRDIVENACPGAGACGGMYTANTMATIIEALGLCLPGSASFPAESEEKNEELKMIGPVVRKLLEMDLKPRDIVTETSLKNAIVVTMVLGGSTNAVLHLLAIAKAFDLKLGLEDFDKIQKTTPFLADLKPSGKYVMEDLHQVGGVPAVFKYLLDQGMLDGSAMTITGKTLAQNIEEMNIELTPEFFDVIHPVEKPLKETGHLAILRGSLAPDGAVAKITGKEGVRFTGRAVVFDSELEMLTGLEEGKIVKGEKQVVIIRNEGPKGGPGMPEMLTPTSAIVGAGLHHDVAMVTDGRFSGGSHGFIIGHVTPEAFVGGPIGLLKDGDIIEIDAEKGTLDVQLSEGEMARRSESWVAPESRVQFGTLKKFSKLVSSASEGCVTDN
eukprot:maker-scaffold_48-snap-gene-1.37-mRNA-1 protein AED:0.02 eAED:0.02 QI:209/1/1/1/0.75/0.6/5/70/592